MTANQPKADPLPSYEEALLDAGKARALFDASKGGNVRGITEDHRFALADVFNRAARTSIEFVRVERDCPANVERRADGNALGIIYDFDVMVDGERRAQMHRDYTGKGYHLQDADGRAIDPPLAHYQTGGVVGSQAQFKQVVPELLDAGKIPTLARMAELRAEEATEAAKKRQDRLNSAREYQIERHAVALRDALKELLRCSAIPDHWADPARAALAAVDQDVADALTRVDARL
jgi:hypothetical protein